MMDGYDGALLSGGGGVDGAAGLPQLDPEQVMDFLCMVTVIDLFTLVALLVLIGVVLGGILTRKWSL